MSIGEIIMWGVVAALVIVPPRYDPAIRLKEWLQRKYRKS